MTMFTNLKLKREVGSTVVKYTSTARSCRFHKALKTFNESNYFKNTNQKKTHKVLANCLE